MTVRTRFTICTSILTLLSSTNLINKISVYIIIIRTLHKSRHCLLQSIEIFQDFKMWIDNFLNTYCKRVSLFRFSFNPNSVSIYIYMFIKSWEIQSAKFYPISDLVTWSTIILLNTGMTLLLYQLFSLSVSVLSCFSGY